MTASRWGLCFSVHTRLSGHHFCALPGYIAHRVQPLRMHSFSILTFSQPGLLSGDIHCLWHFDACRWTLLLFIYFTFNLFMDSPKASTNAVQRPIKGISDVRKRCYITTTRNLTLESSKNPPAPYHPAG